MVVLRHLHLNTGWELFKVVWLTPNVGFNIFIGIERSYDKENKIYTRPNITHKQGAFLTHSCPR